VISEINVFLTFEHVFLLKFRFFDLDYLESNQVATVVDYD